MDVVDLFSAEIAEVRIKRILERQAVRDIGHHAVSLRKTQDRSRELRSCSKTTKSELCNFLIEREEDDSHMLQSLSNYFGTSFTSSYPTTSSTSKGLEVFNMPELFELIMMQLHARDIFAMQLVNTTMCAMVKGSSRLQRYIGLRPDPNAHFHTQFARHRTPLAKSLLCCAETERVYHWFNPPEQSSREPDELGIYAVFTGCKPDLEGLGEACRSMLICQPPITEMSITVECCNGVSRPHGHPRPPDSMLPKPIKRDGGITVGDIIEETLRLIKEHEMCPFASSWHHDDNGNVKVDPRFQGTIRLKPDDPALQEQKMALKRAKQEWEKNTARRAKMRAYIQAKLNGKRSSTSRKPDVLLTYYTAYNAGEKIPTLQEFERESTATGD